MVDKVLVAEFDVLELDGAREIRQERRHLFFTMEKQTRENKKGVCERMGKLGEG